MAAITQPVTVGVFTRSTRSAGTYLTDVTSVPEGVYAVGIADTMTDADASDPSLSFRITIQISSNGVAWLDVHRELWHGGTFLHKDTGLPVPNHIRMAWSNSVLASGAWQGWQARGVLDQLVTMRAGFELTAYPAGFNPS